MDVIMTVTPLSDDQQQLSCQSGFAGARAPRDDDESPACTGDVGWQSGKSSNVERTRPTTAPSWSTQSMVPWARGSRARFNWPPKSECGFSAARSSGARSSPSSPRKPLAGGSITSPIALMIFVELVALFR
jgi:hypothetical protein